MCHEGTHITGVVLESGGKPVLEIRVTPSNYIARALAEAILKFIDETEVLSEGYIPPDPDVQHLPRKGGESNAGD